MFLFKKIVLLSFLFVFSLVAIWCQDISTDTVKNAVDANVRKVEWQMTLLEDQAVQKIDETKQQAVDRVNNLINNTLNDVEWQITNEIQANIDGIRQQISLGWWSTDGTQWQNQWTQESVSTLDACLSTQDITLYAWDQCNYSQQQLSELWVQDRYAIVICQDNMSVCTRKGVQWTPTRSVNWQLLVWVQTKETLALAAQCEWM